MKKIEIEIQHFDGCPNAPILIDRVNEVIKEFAHVRYRETLVDSNKKAEKLKFRGSPTLLINGNDFEERQIPNSASLNCRIYQNGLPTVEDIRKKILKFI